MIYPLKRNRSKKNTEFLENIYWKTDLLCCSILFIIGVANRSALKKYETILKRKVPRSGNVRLLYVSEIEFQDMLLLAGSRSHQEEVVGVHRLVVI